MRYKAVFFDAGQTLWHWTYATAFVPHQRSPHDTALVLMQALDEAGADVDPSEVRRCFDQLQPTFAPQWEAFETDGRGITDAEAEAHFARHNAEFLRLLDVPDPDGRFLTAIQRTFAAWRPVLFPEVRDVLAALQAGGLILAIVSNGWQQEADAARLDIAHYFDAIVGSIYLGCRKPQREIFQVALNSLNCSSEDVVHIGDSYDDDVIGARNAGITPILLDRDGTSAHTDVRTIHSLTELPSIVIGD